MKRPYFAPIAFLAVFVSGCGQKVGTHFDPAHDFTPYRSFAWTSQVKTLEPGGEHEFPQLLKDIQSEITAALTASGFAETEISSADLLLHGHMEFQPYEVEDAEALSPDVPSPKLGPITLSSYAMSEIEREDLNRELMEGAFLLNMTDRKSHEVVWQGWVKRVIDRDKARSAEWGKPDRAYERFRERNIKEGVRRLLERFPPLGKGAATRKNP